MRIRREVREEKDEANEERNAREEEKSMLS